MKISIIIPIYNGEKFLRRCLDSAVGQTFSDLEIIGVDDCSTDHSLAILDEYAARDSRIRIIRHAENKSSHIARMHGIAAAEGEYIMQLDCDDHLEPNACELLSQELERLPRDILEFGYYIHPGRREIYPAEQLPENIVAALLTRDAHYSQLLWNKIVRAEVVKRAYSQMAVCYLNLVDDCYESPVIARNACSYGTVNDCLYHYYSEEGISALARLRNLEQIRRELQYDRTAIREMEHYIRLHAPELLPFTEEFMQHLLIDTSTRILFGTLRADIGPAREEFCRCFGKQLANRIFRLVQWRNPRRTLEDFVIPRFPPFLAALYRKCRKAGGHGTE